MPRKAPKNPQAEAFRLASIDPCVKAVKATAADLTKDRVVAIAMVAIVRDSKSETGFSERTCIVDHPGCRMTLIGGLSQLSHLINQTEANVRMAQAARQVDPASLVGAA